MTALAATFQPGSGITPPSVLLAVTAAPSIPTSYASNFTVAGNFDGWTGSAGTGFISNAPGPVPSLELQGDINTTSTFSRTVTGLTIGQTYRYQLLAAPPLRGSMSLGVSGMTFQAFTIPVTRTALAYTFTATATSHVIQVRVKAPPTVPNVYTNGVVRIDTVTVVKTSGWGGTTIRRTDANGTSVVVREAPGGQDTTGTTGSATMTVTDYEHALTGLVSYTVTDGNGGTATANVTPPAGAGVWATLPATSNPGAPTPPTFTPADLVTDYQESSESNGTVHTIIGREDPVANPGPLSSRVGAVTLWCADYAAAARVRELLAGGATAHLRQPSFPGMDLYLVAQRVSIAPVELVAGTQPWTVGIDYTEVERP